MSVPLSLPTPNENIIPQQPTYFYHLPRRTQLVLTALLSITLLSALQAMLHTDYRETAYLDSYGSLVASQLARLSQDAMVREDAIALNVLAEQVAAETAILHVEIYSMDGATLASYSTPETIPQGAAAAQAESSTTNNNTSRGKEFTRPIQLADATAGFVMVVVANDALQQSHNEYLLADMLRSAAAIVLSVLVSGLAIAHVTATIDPDVDQTITASGPTQPDGAPNGVNETDFYLLMAHLFNGNDMPPTRRDALMTSVQVHANSVAELYQGSVYKVSSTAMAIVFGDINTPERRFQVACAALVVARLGNQPGGARYRYSLQQVRLPQQGPQSLMDVGADDVREDALLHAALAEDNAVALAADFARRLPRPERLELTNQHSPALAALHAGDDRDYYLMSGANTATEAILSKQLVALRAPSRLT